MTRRFYCHPFFSLFFPVSCIFVLFSGGIRKCSLWTATQLVVSSNPICSFCWQKNGCITNGKAFNSGICFLQSFCAPSSYPICSCYCCVCLMSAGVCLLQPVNCDKSACICASMHTCMVPFQLFFLIFRWYSFSCFLEQHAYVVPHGVPSSVSLFFSLKYSWL